MNQLPSSWTETAIGSVCVETEQVTPQGEMEFTYVDIGSVDRFKKKVTAPQRLLGKDAPSRARKLIKTGDTIVSTTRPNLNAVALVDPSLDGQIASTGFEVLRAPGIDPRWIGYLVRTSAFVDAMTSLVQGALYPAVRGKDVRSFEAPIAPGNEQKRIADKLDTILTRVDAVNTRLARVAPLLKRFRQSVLAAATSGRLTEDWRIERNLPEWTSACVGNLVKRVEAGLNVRCTERPPVNDERGLVKISAVTWGRFDEAQSKTLPASTEVQESVRIKVGDFLISRANTLELVGACVIVHEVNRRLYLSDKVLRLQLSDQLKPWLLIVLRSDIGRKQIEALASGNQLSMRNLSQSNLKAISVPLPSSTEVTEIVRRVETLFAFADRLEARLQSVQTAADRLTPSLLAKAFRGELVPQDPNDEPASELLKRLAAAPAALTRKRGSKTTS